MQHNHAARRARLAARVAEQDLAAALITGPVNVRYLTGLASSNAALLVHAGDATAAGGVAADGTTAVLCTDARYAGTAARLCPELEMIVARPVVATLIDRAIAAGVRRLGFEAQHLTVEAYHDLTETGPNAGSAAGSATRPVADPPTGPGRLALVPLGRPVEALRSVKDDDEIALLARACEITDQVFADVLPLLRPGSTERAVAVALERRMVDLGAEGPAFESIVASGPHGAIPHHSPGDRPFERGDLVTMDFGARYAGYHADMTRTVAIGAVADWQRDLYHLVASAQSAGVRAARPGADITAVDAAARTVIDDAGHGADYPHGLGHGVGLEIHEAPLLGPDRTGKLADRIPITAEPGVYLAGRGGIRIEDTLVVRTEGPRLLTTTTKDLLVL